MIWKIGLYDRYIILGAGGVNVSSLKIQQQSPTKGMFHISF